MLNNPLLDSHHQGFEMRVVEESLAHLHLEAGKISGESQEWKLESATIDLSAWLPSENGGAFKNVYLGLCLISGLNELRVVSTIIAPAKHPRNNYWHYWLYCLILDSQGVKFLRTTTPLGIITEEVLYSRSQASGCS